MKKKLPILACLSGLAFTGAFAQEQTEKKDPYTRESDGKKEAGEIAHDLNIVIDVQFVSMPLNEVMAGEKKSLTDTQWRKFAGEKVADGTARVVDSLAIVARSGQRTKLENALQLYSPKERELLPFDGNGPLFPKTFEVMSVGSTFEVDPVLGSDEKTLNLNFALRNTQHVGEIPGSRVPNERLQESDVMNPLFREEYVVSQLDLSIGESRLVTKFDAPSASGKTEEVVLVFIRPDLVKVATSLKPETVQATGSQISLRSSVVEVPAEIWHDWLTGSDLPDLFHGGAWSRIEKALADDVEGVSVVASPKLLPTSGQRAKIQNGETIEFATLFDPPAALGEKAAPKDFKTRALGTDWEIDPVMSTSGRIDLNQRLGYSSMHGYSINYRAEVDGKWQPSVQFPRIFNTTFTGQVVLSPQGEMLVAVGTPADESGAPDLSKKLLFFSHHDTFNQR